jgi:hypothetical protein
LKDFVSTYWIRGVSLIMSVAVFYAILAPQGFALRGLAWVTLALAVVALSVAFVARRSTRSIGQVLRDVDGEPQLTPARSPAPIQSKGTR